MTAREYAKSVDFEIVGKLTKKSYTRKGMGLEERRRGRGAVRLLC